MGPRARGYLLLPVALTLVVVGALAYAMTRDAGMSLAGVEAEYDTEAARYLAEGAFNLALWKNNQQRCNGVTSFAPAALYRYNLASKNIGTTPADLVGTMTLHGVTDITNNSSSQKGHVTVDVSSATPTMRAGSRRIVRTVPRYDLGDRKLTTIRGINGASTFIHNGASQSPQTATAYLELTDNGPSDQSYGLVRFDLGPVPKTALVTEASFRLERYAGGEWLPLPGREVNIHRITTAWDAATATWSFPWSQPGGDFAAASIASSAIFTVPGDTSHYAWRIDALAAGWANGSLPNYGLLLKPTDLYKSHFRAFASSDPDVPQLTVTYYERCT